MRRLISGGLAAVLVAGLTAAVARAADEDDDTPNKQAPLKFGYTGRFGKPRSDEPKESPEDAAKREAAAEARIGARREREFNTYLRRMDACDRLMDIAIAANNEEMQRKVEQLSERVWAVYQQNTDSLGGTWRTRGSNAADVGRLDDASPRSANSGRDKP